MIDRIASAPDAARAAANIDKADRTDATGGFGEVLEGAIEAAGDAEKHAEDLAVRFAEGDPTVGIHEAVIASEKASIAVHFAVSLKNRAIEAYRELMRTPL